MKKFKFLAVALAVLTMASCSKEGVNNNEEPINGEKNVTVKLDVSSSTPSTRAVDDPQADGSKTTIHDGMCYFIDGTNKIVKQFEIDQLSIVSTNGQTFTGVPSSAENFYIVVNVVKSGAVAYPIPDLGSELKALKTSISASVTSQNSAVVVDKSTADRVIMDGTSAGLTATGTGTDMKGTATITPCVARLEIDKITISGATGAVLEGIFINNIYTSIDMGLVKSSIVKKILATDFVPPYTDGMFDHSADNAGIGGTTLIKVPGTNKVWGYQVIPAINTTGTDDNLPHIVIKLKNVMATNQAEMTTAFVTVMKYNSTETPATAITKFEQGFVYKITNIDIKYTDIGPDPEDKTINVTANVVVSPWNIKTIIPVL